MKQIVNELVAALCITGAVYFGCKHDFIGVFFWSAASLAWIKNVLELES